MWSASQTDLHVSQDDEVTPRLELTDRTRHREPISLDFGEIPSVVTDPVEWASEDMNSAAYDICRRAGRSAGDPTPYGQFASSQAKANEREMRWRRRDREIVGVVNVLLREIADLREQLETHARVKADVTELKRDVEPVRGIRKWFAGSIVAIALGIGAFLWQRAGDEREYKLRLELAERAIESLRAERHSSIPKPATTPDFVSSATSRNEP